MARNGKIILCKDINLDRDYKNILDYSESQMVTLCSQSNHKVVEKSDYSFIGAYGDRRIKVDATYSQCLSCNYIAFQNPNYSSKWFFAFIDEVIYLSDGATEIRYTVDECSTWFDKWDPNRCFVIREHVSSDGIGEHTVPENLELGEFIINNMSPMAYNEMNLNIKIVVALTDSLSPIHDNTNREYGGLYSGLYYVAFDSSQMATKFIKGYADEGWLDFIHSVFVLPNKILDLGTKYSVTIGDESGIELYDVPDSTHAFVISNEEVTINSTLNGYTPKNKKLFTWPYNYLTVTNNAGSTAVFKYEDFISNKPKFKIVGTISVGGSIKLLPQDYKKYATDTYNNASALYGLIGAKYPTCGWNGDAYTNWLTQNSVNLGMQWAGATLNVAIGAGRMAVGDVTGSVQAVAGVAGIASELATIYQASFTPNQANGNTNGGDIQYTGKMMSFDYLQMSIRSEYAKIIDDFFTRFGYKVNRLKKPNQVGRPYWNFVQIGEGEEIGSGTVPTKSMEIINQAYRRGVTIWHAHSNIGNFSLDNSI